MSIADDILNKPHLANGRHWLTKVSKETKEECLKIWKAVQEGKTSLPFEVLGERIRDAFSDEVSISAKQVAVWLREKDGDKRCE